MSKKVEPNKNQEIIKPGIDEDFEQILKSDEDTITSIPKKKNNEEIKSVEKEESKETHSFDLKKPEDSLIKEPTSCEPLPVNQLEEPLAKGSNGMTMFLVLLLGFALGYCAYKYTKGQDSTKTNQNSVVETTTPDKNNVDFLTLQSFIKNQHLDYFDYSESNINSVKDISNQRKLNAAVTYILQMYNEQDNAIDRTKYDFKNGVKKDMIDQYMTDTFGKKGTVTHEAIRNVENEVLVNYDKTTGIYSSTIENLQLAYPVHTVYDKIIDFSKDNLTVTVAKTFSLISTDGIYKQFYGNYEDATNSFKANTIEQPLFLYETLPELTQGGPKLSYREYVDRHYQELKNRMRKTTYQFKNEGNNYVLSKIIIK